MVEMCTVPLVKASGDISTGDPLNISTLIARASLRPIPMNGHMSPNLEQELLLKLVR